jgi:hypothetical protein
MEENKKKKDRNKYRKKKWEETKKSLLFNIGL